MNLLLLGAVENVRILDLIVLVVYLGAMAAMGLFMASRNKSTEEYFVGNRSYSGWIIGISMLGTSISSITFLAFPADAFGGNWSQLVMNWMLPIAAIVAIVIFIPLFRSSHLTSAFEYLGHRFGTPLRIYGAIGFLLLQVIRIGSILFLVSTPVSLLFDIDIRTVILCAGIFVAFYTVVGGIDAVIWTDVIQSFVLWFGGIICVLYIAFHLPGGLGQVFEVGSEFKKFDVGDFDFDLSRNTFWTAAFLGIINFLGMYCSDQTFVQRYVSAKSTKEARKAAIIYSIIAVPTWTFFFFLGTCVFVYYQQFPTSALPDEAKYVFPYFILHQIPPGIAGLVIAGVLAAAMSSLDSSLNSISTVFTIDFLKPYLAPNRDDKYYLTVAKWVAIIFAVLMIAGALIFNELTKTQTTNQLSWIVASIFGGCLTGLFLVGFFTTRVKGNAAALAVGVAILANIFLNVMLIEELPELVLKVLNIIEIGPLVNSYITKLHTLVPFQVNTLWVGPLVNLIFIVVAYVSSFLLPSTSEDLAGLTIWTYKKSSDKK
ncbi:MAG: sodium:solute symporter [Pirellulales bacterium]